jgi:hypothetical protein
MLGYSEAALADADLAHKDAREIGHAVTLIYALCHGSLTHFLCGNYPTATAEARSSGAILWAPLSLAPLQRQASSIWPSALGCSLAAGGKNADAKLR